MLHLRRASRWSGNIFPLLVVLNAGIFVTLLHYLLLSADYGFNASAQLGRTISHESSLPEQPHRNDCHHQSATEASFSPCAPGDSACAEYSDAFVIRSRAYEGLNTRLRRVLREADPGHPIKVGIIGGSVTWGQGVKQNETWVALFSDWWHKRFPQSNLTLTNGAVPATGSGYWSMCFREHIDEDVDLVLTELAINDQRQEANGEWFEWLVRQLLELPRSPAVVQVQVLALAFKEFPTITTGGDLHLGVASYYDTPVIRLRNALLPAILAEPESAPTYFTIDRYGQPDLKHINVRGHRMLIELLKSHMLRQLWLSKETYDLGEKHDTLPRLRMFQRYDAQPSPRLRPYCASTRSLRTPLVPAFNDGRWAAWNYTAPGGSEKSYIMAKEPGAKVGFKVPIRDTGGLGRVRLQSLRSKTLGLGVCKCWIGDETQHTVYIDGYWETNLSVVGTTVIATDVPMGEHMLWCEVTAHTKNPERKTEFRIIAVDAA